jgi:hypothetical protein
MGFVAHIDAQRFGARRALAVDFDGAVGGAHDAHIVTEGREFLGQSAGHIGESSDLDERFDFRGDQENSQGAHGG